MRTALAIAALLLFPACSDTDSPPLPDAATFDAALGSDASEILPDAAQTTLCGMGKNEIECLADTEICVNEDLGGTIVSSCVTLPNGCDVRDCASCDVLCEAPADTCDDDLEENTISCVCLEC